MRALQTALVAAAAAAVQQAAAMRPAALHPTIAMRPTNAPLSRRCILAAPVLMPRRANALYDTKTVDAAKATYDVADATKVQRIPAAPGRIWKDARRVINKLGQDRDGRRQRAAVPRHRGRHVTFGAWLFCKRATCESSRPSCGLQLQHCRQRQRCDPQRCIQRPRCDRRHQCSRLL